MPTHFGPEPPADSEDDDDDSDDEKIYRRKKDEYGEDFEDYGFLTRAQEKKEAGNRHFQRERYSEALKQYQDGIDDTMTCAHDPSIHLSKKKWVDIVIFRATLHLNKSTCYFKMRDFRQSCASAVECIIGNARETSMFSDPHVRKKLKAGERKEGTFGGQMLQEKRLPKWLRAKAWFRMSQCYCNLEYCDRAKEALAKSLEMAEGTIINEIQAQMAKIEGVEKRLDRKQRKQFSGFFNKLQDRGGYIEEEEEKVGPKWDALNYEEKFKKIQELDDSDEEGDSRISSGVNTPKRPPPMSFMSEADRERAARVLREKLSGLKIEELNLDECSPEEKRHRLLHGLDSQKLIADCANTYDREKSTEIDQSFDEYQKKKASGGYATTEPPQSDTFRGFDEDTLRAAGLDPEILKAVPPLKPQASEEKPVERPKAAFKLPFAKQMFDDPRSAQPPPKEAPAPKEDTKMQDALRDAELKRQQEIRNAKEKHARELQETKQTNKDNQAAWKARVEALDDSDEDP